MCKLSNIKRFMHSDFTEKDKINELNLAFDEICRVLISSDISYKLKDKNTLQPSIVFTLNNITYTISFTDDFVISDSRIFIMFDDITYLTYDSKEYLVLLFNKNTIASILINRQRITVAEKMLKKALNTRFTGRIK